MAALLFPYSEQWCSLLAAIDASAGTTEWTTPAAGLNIGLSAAASDGQLIFQYYSVDSASKYSATAEPNRQPFS